MKQRKTKESKQNPVIYGPDKSGFELFGMKQPTVPDPVIMKDEDGKSSTTPPDK